jgi:hypothetical protein
LYKSSLPACSVDTGAEVTESSTNKQHHLSRQASHAPSRGKFGLSQRLQAITAAGG